MTGVWNTLALLASAAGLISALAAYAALHHTRAALLVLLDFLTAAGLLHLAATTSWTGIATAAAVIAVRKLVSAELQRHG